MMRDVRFRSVGMAHPASMCDPKGPCGKSAVSDVFVSFPFLLGVSPPHRHCRVSSEAAQASHAATPAATENHVRRGLAQDNVAMPQGEYRTPVRS